MAFQQGLSGLNAAGKALDVTGNNIANSATVGFKFARTNFADVFGASMVAGGGSPVGIGVNIAAVQQQFTQGNMTATSNPLDLAINGSGFFKVGNYNQTTGVTGAENYTRNGQFHLDNAGYIINDQGMNLMGIPASAAGVIPEMSDSEMVPLNVSENVGTPAATGNISIKANLNGESTVIASQFDPADSSTYNSKRSMDVYDSQGGAHTLSYYFAKTASNAWSVYTTLGDKTPAGVATTIPDPATYYSSTNLGGTAYTSSANITFDTTGLLVGRGTAAAEHTVSFANLNSAPPLVVDDLSMAIDFSTMTQFKSPFAVDSMTQDGYGKGKLAGLQISADGTVQAKYDTGKTTNIGRIPLYNFANPNGLQSLGNNLWAETYVSGVPTGNYPGDGNTGILQSATLEESNVDLTQEMVNLIIEQRNYQANAQTIKTQDQIMQTLVNLR